jgi:PPOX class probable F420-dependent enzyme
MTRLPESAIALIESGAHGHLVTINADGSPQVSMVWVGSEGDELCVASLSWRKKLENVTRDPRVAVTFEAPAAEGETLRSYLAVVGTARITEGGGPALLQRLAHVYLGPDRKFPPGDDPPEGWIMRIAPERRHGHGPWSSYRPPSDASESATSSS